MTVRPVEKINPARLVTKLLVPGERIETRTGEITAEAWLSEEHRRLIRHAVGSDVILYHRQISLRRLS